MNTVKLLADFFGEQLGNGYRIDAQYSLYNDRDPSEMMRMLKDSDELVQEALRENRVRGIVNVSQSPYVALSGVHSVSLSWSISFAQPIDNKALDGDLQRLIDMYTAKIISVKEDDKAYKLTLTFNTPSKFITNTISGTTYQQVVFGGQATMTDYSDLGNAYTVTMDGENVAGLLSLSAAYNAQGENWNQNNGGAQQSATQSFVNGLTMQVHILTNSALHDRLRAAAFMGDTDPFAVEITHGDTVWSFPQAVLGKAVLSTDTGGFVVADLQFLRE